MQAAASLLTSIRFYLQLSWRGSPPLMLASVILNILGGLVPLAHVYFSSRLLQILADGMSATPAVPAATHELPWLIGLWAAAAVIGQGITHFGGAVQQLHQKRTTTYAQQLVASHAASLDAANFDDASFHTELQIASTECASRPAQCTQNLMRLISAATGLFAMGTVVLLWQPWLIPVLMIGPFVLVYVAARTSEDLRALRDNRAEMERTAQYSKAVLTSDRTLKDIRLYGLKDFFLERFVAISRETFRKEREIVTKRLLYRGVPTLLTGLDRPLLVGYIAYQCLRGAITLGQFSLYSQALVSFQSQLRVIAGAIAQLQEASVFSRSLFGFLQRKPRLELAGTASADPGKPAPLPIEFHEVSFSYPGGARRVLQEVSFTLSPGEIVAIVGRNGSGKTTIGRLLGRLYAPDAGTITMGGANLAALDPAFLRSQLGFVSQDHTIFDLSIRENIALGEASAPFDHARMIAAAQAAGLDAIVARLPKGYDTILGRSRAGGHELSGGQKQLLALARAWYRHAPVMVLDEPNSALDVFAEQRNFEPLFSSRRNHRCATLLISHRLPVVRHADRILVLDNGTIAEDGTHAELLQLDGLYARMFRAQGEEAPIRTFVSSR